MVEPAKRYSIEELLRNGVQPWFDASPDELETLKHTITQKGGNLRQMPVSLSADDILFDGHQRLQAMLALGRKTISAGEYRRDKKVKGREAAYDEAVQIGWNRRNLSGKAKAHKCWEYFHKDGLSQGAIAAKIGIKQPSVSELMKKYPEETNRTHALGKDGKWYPVDYADYYAKNGSASDGASGSASDGDEKQLDEYGYRQRITKNLGKLTNQVANIAADSMVCGVMDPFSLSSLREGFDNIKASMDRIVADLTERSESQRHDH